MEMFKVGDELELDLTSPMFTDAVFGDMAGELDFCKKCGLVPNKVYKVLRVEENADEDGKWTLVALEGVDLHWCPSRFKHAVTTLENE